MRYETKLSKDKETTTWNKYIDQVIDNEIWISSKQTRVLNENDWLDTEKEKEKKTVRVKNKMVWKSRTYNEQKLKFHS